MPKAFCTIRKDPHYRHDAFAAGLRAAGYQVIERAPQSSDRPEGARGDVLVIWNRYGVDEVIADRFESTGGAVMVAENGYLGVDRHKRRIYALARDFHNGRGTWPDGGPERFEALGVEVKPWRTGGEHILVAANRSFGTRGNIMDTNWAGDVSRRLRRITKRPVRNRLHPGNHDPAVPLEQDLKDCWAVAIWSSSVGVAALVAGIPVICEANWWICTGAAGRDITQIENPPMNDEARMAALHRMAWAQFSVDEIASGEPFKRLTVR